MTKPEAIEILTSLHGAEEPSVAHRRADQVLLALINDDEVTEVWTAVPRGYRA